MSKKARQLFINTSLLVLTICFLFLGAEMLARALFSDIDDGNWVGSEKKYYEYDPLLGWKKIPNMVDMRATAGKAPVRYELNSKGIRGPEYAYKKSHNEYRILFLGDSFADGYMVEFHEMFSEVMKKGLNEMRDDRYYESINTGTTGWSTDQELLFFQNEGKKYNPDLTVLMFYENDITYVNQGKDWGMYYKPFFKVKDGKLILTNFPVPEPDLFVIQEPLESTELSVFKSMRNWLNLNSYLYKFSKERIRNTHFLRKMVIKDDKTEDRVHEDVFFPIEYRAWEINSNATVREAWRTMEAIIINLNEETVNSGSRLLVFYVPFEASIYLEEWGKLKKMYGLTDDKWSSDQSGLVLEELCKRNNIDFLNPTDLFKVKALASVEGDKRLYDPLDHHWSVEGNKFAGEILVEFIVSHYLKK